MSLENMMGKARRLTGYPVAGTGRRGRFMKFSGHGENAAKKVTAWKKSCCWPSVKEKRDAALCGINRSGRVAIDCTQVQWVQVGAAHCSGNAIWINNEMVRC